MQYKFEGERMDKFITNFEEKHSYIFQDEIVPREEVSKYLKKIVIELYNTKKNDYKNGKKLMLINNFKQNKNESSNEYTKRIDNMTLLNEVEIESIYNEIEENLMRTKVLEFIEEYKN